MATKLKTQETKLPDLKSVAQADVRAPGTGFDPMQDLQRSQLATKKVGLPSGGLDVTASPTVNANNLGSVPSPVTPIPPQGAITQEQAFVDSTQKAIDEFNRAYQSTQKEVTPIQTERTALTTKLEETLKGITGRGAAQLQAEQVAGVPEQQKKLQELNLQIAQRKAEYDKTIAGLPGQGRGITTGIIAGQTAREQRMAAVELGSLASVAQAVQGNLALSQQTADRTVQLEFADKQQEIDNLKTLLDLNYDKLNSAEKKQADQLNFVLQQRQGELDQARQYRLEVLSLSKQAAQNGADTSTLTKMSQAKSPEEALQIGGQYLTAKEKKNTAVVEIGGKQKLIDTQTGETIKELGVSTEEELKLEQLRLNNQKSRVELGLAPLGNAGSTSNIDTFMNALSGQESGGDYTAQNARTGAFGKFQIMPANWPKWSVEAGLPAGSQQTPENQEKVAQFKLNQYYQKYGNWADVASIWYSGKPFSQVEAEGWADRKQGDGSEPSVREYVNSVLSKLPSQTIKLDSGDAAKLNKEVATSDTYKAIIKSQDAIRALDNFDKIFREQGGDLETFGVEAGKLKQAHKDALLVLKEYFNLGVLNGPDQKILEEVLPNPTSFSLRFFGGADAVRNGIETMRQRIYQTLNDRKSDLDTAYHDYGKDQLSNLQNAERIANTLMAQNEMIVIDRATGQKGTIPRNEFDPDLYEEVK